MKRFVMLVVALATLLAPAAGSARVDGTSPGTLHGSRPLGISLSKSGAAAAAFAGLASGQTVTYHGGPVMHSNQVYTIFWDPSGAMTPSYESLINGYFHNVANASGTADNVNAVDTQYYDGDGPIAYDVTWGGSVVDTDPYPASGCDDGIDPSCLTEDQLINEAYDVISYEGWPSGLGAEYFIYTPQNVGSCIDAGPANCAYTLFCAYHSAFTDEVSDWIFADEPYNGVAGCDAGEHPNGDPADATINTSSHEQNESITDPFGDAWYNDATGDEIADECAWVFGPSLGGSPGQVYDQVIGDGHYYLQGEWSNASSDCEWSYASAPVNTSLPQVSGTTQPGDTISALSGDWSSTGSISYSYQWQQCDSTGANCSDLGGETGTSYTIQSGQVGDTFRVVVSATAGIYTVGATSDASSVVVATQRPGSSSSPPTGSRPPAPPSPPTGTRPSPP